ncbi:uncharacterized protein TM35_000032990 [Trypanosoma theileri]|uniref:Uncharacterized protein n=1 Tax=Trypanosoma theileri TaxID=67003 RepID=A0A1X0P6H5_9TRYP|nr:uncharacterized protein TM35_000032990 [Trypanosoma theileri]ORC92546.1 hypothetical protein TM35_000032990 [Trypanosoma theileri]
MSAEIHHYSPYSYGGQQIPGGDVTPIVYSSASGTYAAPVARGAESAHHDNPSKRIPCCCEVFRQATGSVSHGDDHHHHHHHHHHHYHNYHHPHHHHPHHHHHDQKHYPEYYGQYGEGTEGQLPPQYRSSSRRCYCCVPEQEELQECERLAKEKRYQSLRAEREQLKTALYDDLWKGEAQRRSRGPSYRYRSNTADLLRYSQGTFYQQAVAMEQDRRRQQLRREIEERRRELNVRTRMSYPTFTSTPISSAPRMMMSRQNVRPLTSTRNPVVVCTTENLKRHNTYSHRNQQNVGGISARVLTTGTNTGCSTPHAHVRRQQRSSVQTVNKGNNPTGEQTAAAGVEAPEPERSGTETDAGMRHTAVQNCEGKKKWRSSPPSPRGDARNKGHCCCCCCCHVCQPCAPWMRSNAAHSAGVVPAAKQATVAPQPQLQPKPQPQPKPQSPKPIISKKKEETTAPTRTVSMERSSASPVSQSQLTVVEHGRKVYITDDVYLYRRSQVIERLEQDGFVRRLNPTNRSPSAPLPEKTRKWTTTRSTSAHRVCV